MPANHSQQARPGCFGALLKLIGIGYQPPKKTDIQVEYLPAEDESLPYRLRDDFLSPAEKSFYHLLQNWAQGRYAIFTKVSLSDLFFVVRPNEHLGAYNRINQKHVDFVVCDAETVAPLFAVELDDRSHARADRMERDQFVDDVFEAANLPLLHIPVRASYHTSELARMLEQALQKQGSTGDDASALPEAGEEPLPTMDEPGANGEAPFCPKCGTRMVLRTARSGNQAGNQFYGCPNYPRCRVVLPLVNG